MNGLGAVATGVTVVVVLVAKFRQGAWLTVLLIPVLHLIMGAILSPIVDYVLEVERTCPNQQVAVLIPELVQRRWYHHLLHNKRAAVLKGLLLLKGNQRIIVINVPWYLES